MNSRRKWITKAIHYILKIILMEISHRIKQIISLKIFPKTLVRFFNILTQDYTGHITIKFIPTLSDYSQILSNPDREKTAHFIEAGEKQCFIEMSKIRVFMKIEKAISEAIRGLKKEARNGRESKLSVINENEADKDDSIITEKEKEKASLEIKNHLEDDYWKYIHNFDDNFLNTPTISPSNGKSIDLVGSPYKYPLQRKKSSDSYHSLSSVGGSLK